MSKTLGKGLAVLGDIWSRKCEQSQSHSHTMTDSTITLYEWVVSAAWLFCGHMTPEWAWL